MCALWTPISRQVCVRACGVYGSHMNRWGRQQEDLSLALSLAFLYIACAGADMQSMPVHHRSAAPRSTSRRGGQGARPPSNLDRLGFHLQIQGRRKGQEQGKEWGGGLW